jgi:hypothetical protein
MDKLTLIENSLIPVYQSDKGTRAVSARELYERLNSINDFKDFFINVSEIKTDLMRDDLKILREVVDAFDSRFGAAAIVYLVDSITAEMVLPCKNEVLRNLKEKQLQNMILANFKEVFPQYNLVGSEVLVEGIGRIDILAEEKSTKKSVIFELKTGSGNPNKQLIAYSSQFGDPILIGITEIPLNDNMKLNNIAYLVFDEIKKSVKQWIDTNE